MQEPLRLRGDVGHNLDPFGRFEPSVLMKTIVDEFSPEMTSQSDPSPSRPATRPRIQQ